MARHPLNILLIVRQRGVDQQCQAFATCLKLETTAMEAVRALDDAAQREREAADRHPEHHGGMDMLATWLRRMRADRVRGSAALAAAQGQTALSRAALAAARSAAQVVEKLIEDRAAEARAKAEAREQHALDDIARSQHLARGVEACAPKADPPSSRRRGPIA